MAYKPLAKFPPQFHDGGSPAAGYWLKGYTSGTTTPLSMGTDSTPTSTLVKCKLNTDGYPLSDSGDDTSIFVPHFNANFKLVLYANETDADNNTTGSAAWIVDALDYGESSLETSVTALQGALSAPAGTVMAFFQAGAPTGWTQVTTHNNKMMRVVSGTGGTAGGTDSPIALSIDLSHAHTVEGHTLTSTEVPAHTHGIDVWSGVDTDATPLYVVGRVTNTGGTVNATLQTATYGGGAAHSHGNTGTNTLTATWSPAYIDLVLASKD